MINSSLPLIGHLEIDGENLDVVRGSVYRPDPGGMMSVLLGLKTADGGEKWLRLVVEDKLFRGF